MKKESLIVLVILLSSLISADGQTALEPQDDIQSWNDLQLTLPMSKEFDFWTSLTMRFGKNITRLNDGRFGIGFVYKPHKAWAIQPFYLSINMRNSRGRFRLENRLNLRVAYRFPLKNFGLSHRSLFEYRIRNTGDSWRYRPSLTIEKDLPKKINGKVFLTEEIFYDSALDRFSRNRVTVGVTKNLSKKLALDIYFMRQNDGNSRPGDLSVIGTSWKIKL
jgi:hypothetical protein